MPIHRFQALLQADVLMLFYLLPTEELVHLLDRLGYGLDPSVDVPRTIDYYLRRTSHGSTLSRVVHAWVLARFDRPRSWDLFTQSLESDIADVQRGSTAEGVHLGAMPGPRISCNVATGVLRCSRIISQCAPPFPRR
jgi:alpha,alpha-trehalase